MKQDIWPHENNDGFTLIENVIAIFIIATAIFGLVSVTVMILKANTFSEMQTTATTLAQDRLEELKSRTYTNITAGGPETVDSLYSRSWTVATNSPANNMKTIAVTVNWSWLSLNHTVSVNSIVAD